MKQYQSPDEALNDLKERGYYADFGTDSVCLYCGELDIRLNPEAFQIDEVHHFEADTNPDDNSIVYAITSSTGMKGTLVAAHGVFTDHPDFKMAEKLHHG